MGKRARARSCTMKALMGRTLRYAAAVLAIVLALPDAPRSRPGDREAPEGDEARLLALVNAERERRGIASLAWSETLARVARRHARDMRDAGRASHRSRDGTTFEGRLVRAEIRLEAAAENVGYARDVVHAHEGLMESPGHRKNILDPHMRDLGVGVVREEGRAGVYVVQNFAAIVPDLTEAEAAARIRRLLRDHASGLSEDADLSRRMAAEVARLAGRDSIEVDGIGLAAEGWIMAWTSSDPRALPERVRVNLEGRARYGVGVVFRRTASYPFGTWWVLLALEGRER